MIRIPGFGQRGFIFGQRNNEGPPDLDEVFRDLSDKVNRMFGKSGNGGGERNLPPTGSGLPIVPILVLIVLIWLATGFYIVDTGSVGVEQRFGKYTQTTEPGPRWHLPYPLESVTVVNMEQVRRLEVGYRSNAEGMGGKTKVAREALMLTEDENIIDLQFAVQYKLKSAKDYLFNNRAIYGDRLDTGETSAEDGVIRAAAETAIREVVGKNKLDDLLQQKEKGMVDTQERIQNILDSYVAGVVITSVSQQSAQPPEPVQEAFEDVNRANQDYQRQINEGQAYANDVVPKARGMASRLAAEAAGYKLRVENEAKGDASRFDQVLIQYSKAPEVTRQRLYLEAQEQILSSTSKVIVDQKGGSLLYLPLDKLMSASGSSAATIMPSAVSGAEAAPGSSGPRELGRDRESR